MSRAVGIALAGAALILAAFTFDASPLFVPGVGFALLGVLVPPWIWLAARGASVSRSLEADRVVEEQPFEARIKVGRGPLGLPGGEVLDPLAGATVKLSGSRSVRRAERSTELRVVARFPTRGRRRLEAPAVALSDPLGLVRIVHRGVSSAQELLVLPRTEPVRWAQRETGGQLDTPAAAAWLDALAATEVDGLRPYRPGTPASRISWPALARGAGLLERRLRADRDAGPLVVLDARCAGHSERIDAAVRAAASLTLELARRAGCELLLPGARRALRIDPDLSAWGAAHAHLAVIEGGPDAPPPWLTARPRIGPVFYVAAERDRLPARLLRGGQRGGVLVLPNDLAPAVRHVASFEVSGCRGYLLGSAGLAAAPREAGRVSAL
jgi:uncharacterized protein (DUF58 family)